MELSDILAKCCSNTYGGKEEVKGVRDVEVKRVIKKKVKGVHESLVSQNLYMKAYNEGIKERMHAVIDNYKDINLANKVHISVKYGYSIKYLTKTEIEYIFNMIKNIKEGNDMSK